jgi:beta-lactam-binding protein with PASTA domain
MSSSSPRRLAGAGLAALGCAVLSACAPAFGKLDGILVDDRPALPSEFGRVQVTREGKVRNSAPKMSIAKGDVIVTANDGVALTTLRAGYEVIFEPGTDATIENPSIFVRLGKLIVKTVQAIKERLTVNDQFTSSGVDGTVFVYEVTRDQTTHIAVLEGRVTVRSKAGRWDSVTYVAGEAGTIRANSAPSRMQRIDPGTARAIRQRIAVVEGTARPTVPDLRGERQEAARPALEAVGLRLGSVVRIVTRERPAGFIVSTRPAAGTVGKAGDRVSLQVADSALMIPNVLNRSIGEAFEILAAAGFPRPDTASMYQPDAEIGSVTGMAPSGGELVSASTRVQLTFARHTPDPVADTTRSGGSCTVPNLIERTEAEARRALSTAKLRAGKVTHRESGTRVTEQSRERGSSVKCGTAVDFVVGSIGD